MSNKNIDKVREMLNVELIPDGKTMTGGIKRKVRDLEQIPTTKDFLVLTDEEYPYLLSLTETYQSSNAKGLGLFILKDSGKILVPDKVCSYGREVNPKDLEHKGNLFPRPIVFAELFNSNFEGGYYGESKSNSFKLANNYFEGNKYIINAEGDKKYSLDWQTVSDKDVGIVVDESRKENEEKRKWIISFDDYLKNKIMVESTEPNSVGEIDLREFISKQNS